MVRELARWGAPAVLLLLSLGCNERSRTRSEASGVSRAVDALRGADNAQKRGFLAELRAVPCTETDVCAVRSACLAAYELHLDALENAANAVGFADAGSGERAAAALGTAQADLLRARELTERCTTMQGEMVRRYGVNR